MCFWKISHHLRTIAVAFILLGARQSFCELSSTDREFEVLSYYQTSGDPAAETIECVLSGTCKKGWSPQSVDSGRLEGLFVRFRKPQPFSFTSSNNSHYWDHYRLVIEFDKSQKAERAFEPYFDGNFVEGFGELTRAQNGNMQVEFSNPSQDELDGWSIDQLSTLFLRWSDIKNKPIVKRIYFLKNISAEKAASLPKKQVYVTTENSSDGSTPEKVSRYFQVMTPILPASAPLTSVKASSQLDPIEAYQPANMFDSIDSFAFSFNGKKNNGVGESITFDFKQPLDIAGIVIWNGYQRSKTHFAANGRIKSLAVSTGKTPAQIINLSDEFGNQEVTLAASLKNTSSLRFEIKDIYPGTKYKDLLISELMFVSSDGRHIKPMLPKIRPDSGSLAKIVDRTWTSRFGKFELGEAVSSRLRWSGTSVVDVKFGEPRGDNEGFFYTFDTDLTDFAADVRMRSNGTFVVYTKHLVSRVKVDHAKEKAADDDGKVQSRKVTYARSVLEGNWVQEEGGKIRIFGRRYHTFHKQKESVQTSENSGYRVLDDQNKSDASDGIFQSYIKLRRFNEIPPLEEDRIVKALALQHGIKDLKIVELKQKNPLIFESDVLTAALVETR